jgi:dipeptidyl aminopeptidase/acylaminoacyl peptidase
VSWNGGTGAHLWQPTEFQEIDGRQVLEIWGNLVGKQFYADMSMVNVLENLRRARGPVLIVQSEADEAIHEPVQTAQRIAQTLQEAGIAHNLIIIRGADHAFMRVIWEREVIDKTVDWLKTQF